MSVFDDYRRRTYEPTDIAPEQTELATSLRIPFIRNDLDRERWNYVTGIYVGVFLDSAPVWTGVVPTDDEVRMVASFCDEYRTRYRESFANVMAEFASYDIDGGANLGFLRKLPDDGGWCYRKRTWTSGPPWWPTPQRGPKSLIEVLDRIHAYGDDEVTPNWARWKADHPEVFGAAAVPPTTGETHA